LQTVLISVFAAIFTLSSPPTCPHRDTGETSDSDSERERERDEEEEEEGGVVG
jgi:hypothetical protein